MACLKFKEINTLVGRLSKTVLSGRPSERTMQIFTVPNNRVARIVKAHNLGLDLWYTIESFDNVIVNQNARTWHDGREYVTNSKYATSTGVYHPTTNPTGYTIATSGVPGDNALTTQDADGNYYAPHFASTDAAGVTTYTQNTTVSGQGNFDDSWLPDAVNPPYSPGTGVYGYVGRGIDLSGTWMEGGDKLWVHDTFDHEGATRVPQHHPAGYLVSLEIFDVQIAGCP
jgi:hypothetical protein|tara:strand:+ start:6531 stop:7214 length:684 start_codon:yes stop_codon:yes gene_type:complete